MNTTTTISDVEHILDCGTKPGCDHDGSRYWTRMIVCHGGGKTATLILHARKPEPLDFTPSQSIEAGLAEMDNETLDSLANAVRAERQSRHPEPAPDAQDFPTAEEYEAATLLHEKMAAAQILLAPDDDVPAGVTVTEHLAARYAEIDRHPRDFVPSAQPRECRECGDDALEGTLFCLRHTSILPRDCLGVTVTEDDGEVPF